MLNPTIKKFYFNIGGFPGPWYSIEYKNGVYAYRSEPKYMETAMDITPLFIASEFENDEQLVHKDSISADLTISAEKMDRFYQYIKRYCKDWKTKYSIGPICDGTHWACDIWIDDFRLRSEGHEAYPSNFDTLLHKLSIVTSGKIFG